MKVIKLGMIGICVLLITYACIGWCGYAQRKEDEKRQKQREHEMNCAVYCYKEKDKKTNFCKEECGGFYK